MKKLINKVALGATFVGLSALSLAQTTGGGSITPPDYSADTTAFGTAAATFVSAEGLPLLGVLLTLLGFGWLWRYVRRTMHSS